MTGILLGDAQDRDVMEHAFPGQPVVASFGQNRIEQRQKDAFRRLGQKTVLHRRTPNDCGRIDGVAAMGDGGHMENRVFIHQRIIAGMIAEWTLHPPLFGIYIAFQNKFRFRRDFQIHCAAWYHWHWFAANEARQEHLIDPAWQRSSSGVSGGRIGADGYRYRHAPAETAVFTIVMGTILVNVPVHAGGGAVENLQPVHTRIAAASLEAAGYNHRKGDERATVVRPAVQHRQEGEIYGIAGENHFLAGCMGLPPREELKEIQCQRQQSKAITNGLGRFHFNETAQACRQSVQIGDPQSYANPSLAAKSVGQHRKSRSLDGFKQQSLASPRALRGQIGNVRDFQVSGHWRTDASQFAGLFQGFHEFLQVAVGGLHRFDQLAVVLAEGMAAVVIVGGYRKTNGSGKSVAQK